MDPKSTAKSKRSHTQHAKAVHNPHKSKPQKNQSQPAGKEKPHPSRPSLPSNWDRYGEDYLEGDADRGKESAPVAGDPAKAAGGSGAVMPKSKGADFGFLIQQARSELPIGGLRGSDLKGSGSYFDDSIPDYLQDLTPSILARGEGLMLSCRNDNFIVDGDRKSNHEVPYLSLDLHALAAQLSKMKMSQRLFIDPIYVPEELDDNGSNESRTMGVPSENIQRINVESVTDLYASIAPAIYNFEENLAQDNPPDSSTKQMAGKQLPKEASENCLSDSKSLVQESTGDIRGQTSSLSSDRAMCLASNVSSHFKATSTTAEFDALHSSLSETKTLNSSKSNINAVNTSLSNLTTHDASSDLSIISKVDVSRSSNDAMKIISPDSTIDDLLAETQPLESFAVYGYLSGTVPLCAQTGRNEPSSVSLDVTIDELLAETSSDIKNKKYMGKVTELHTVEASSVNSNAHSKTLDDFDSWLDTI